MKATNCRVLASLVHGISRTHLSQSLWLRSREKFLLHSRSSPCLRYLSSVNVLQAAESTTKRGRKLDDVPDLKSFLSTNYDFSEPTTEIIPPYMENALQSCSRKVYFEAYGCQMNVNDTEYAWAILQKSGYLRTDDIDESDIILLVTCSIREKAEEKIWGRLQKLRERKRRCVEPGFPKIGILGCMAERLKKQILDKEKCVDVIAGPDAYRDLPRLLSECTENSTTAINVMLSADETYADIMPVRFNQESKKAFVSIMRGCDNMCSYCIVPFTRGRERSRAVTSILDEIRMLSDQGIKQVTLLGQNVNSYRDLSEIQYTTSKQKTSLSKGFKTIYKPKLGGLRFADLLDKVSMIDPEMRIRFTSPHPKDFPDEVLEIMKDRRNICKQVHMPAQSGSTDVLARMRRGYTREDYLDLAHKMREYIPGITISTDMISGFCGETENEHQDTLSLMRVVKYENAFLFAYSMRKKTHAYHRMEDDVSVDVKRRRLQEVIDCYYEQLPERLEKYVGEVELVLIEGTSKKLSSEMAGRNDGNIKVIVPNEVTPNLNHKMNESEREIRIGDYVEVKIVETIGSVLRGTPVGISSIGTFHQSYSQTR